MQVLPTPCKGLKILMQARLLKLWLAEPVFFASRELSDTYLTEGVLGNYALAYALGWAKSAYRLDDKQASRPTYREDLARLDCYILPAWPQESARYRFERFNALSDAYWFMMTNNRVATAREHLAGAKDGGKPNEFRASNYPQAGRLRLLERDQVFETLVFGSRELPEYIRLGKFNSKVRVEVADTFQIEELPAGNYHFTGLLNPADVPQGIRLVRYDLVNIAPVPLLQGVHFEGPAWKAGEWTIPANLQFTGGPK